VKEIILIDDEPLINRIHTVLIRSAKPDQLLTAFTDPTLGFEYVRDYIGNRLVLLDINMPTMNAWDFLNALAENGVTVDVIILSSSINPEDKIKAISYKNVKAFLNKPLSKENIKKLIDADQTPIEWPSIELE